MGIGFRHDLNWNFLHYFCVVAEFKSIKLASERLNLSSSTLSEGIQSLEKRLSCKLLSRDSRRIELTAHGRALFNQIKPIFENQYRILESIEKESDDLPSVSVGLVPSESFPGSFELINSIVGFARAAKFLVRSCDHDRLETMLDRGEVDIGLTNCAIRTKNVVCRKISDCKLSFYVHKDFAGIPFRTLVETLKVGLFGADNSHLKIQNYLGSTFGETTIHYFLTDYPSLLFNACLEKRAIVGYASEMRAAVHPDFSEVRDQELQNFNYKSEQYLVWAKRIEGSLLHAHLLSLSSPARVAEPAADPEISL